jgi:hypothetical protein
MPNGRTVLFELYEAFPERDVIKEAPEPTYPVRNISEPLKE